MTWIIDQAQFLAKSTHRDFSSLLCLPQVFKNLNRIYFQQITKNTMVDFHIFSTEFQALEKSEVYNVKQYIKTMNKNVTKNQLA